jgi:hypothetical protein
MSNRDDLLSDHRYINVDDNWWSAHIIDDFVEVAEKMGIDMAPSRRLDNGVFWESHPWHAAFQGRWRWDDLCWLHIREMYPTDEVLHRIADALWAAGKAAKPFYDDGEDPELEITINHRGPGGGGMSFAVYDHAVVWDDDADADGIHTTKALNALESAVEDACKDLCRWLARSLEAEYDYQTSDEAVWEAIERAGLDQEEDEDEDEDEMAEAA